LQAKGRKCRVTHLIALQKTAGRQSSLNEAEEDPKEEDAESPKDEESKQEQD
jgi:hypothetical protein